MCTAAGKLGPGIHFFYQGRDPGEIPLIIIGDDQLRKYMLIFLECPGKARLIKLDGAVRLPGGQISVSQDHPVIKSIRKLQVIFQPADPRVLADKHTRDPLLPVHPLTTGKDLRKYIRDTADQRQKDDQPDPFALCPLTYAMDSTNGLETNGD